MKSKNFTVAEKQFDEKQKRYNQELQDKNASLTLRRKMNDLDEFIETMLQKWNERNYPDEMSEGIRYALTIPIKNSPTSKRSVGGEMNRYFVLSCALDNIRKL